ncbi:MAG: tRNA (uridine(34)/cytosine(34)/5-carboxymethylaminomethyluridine(34)-2'-O)-methyltransferase TrmL [Firmicutes bacterium]|nr:tRNA (uridine(34)/cytosine(34)/5-carboxymethylaminomethyluridine(34)-2'-O)-methyltransferase TrmL [Bacillota bacterium]
MHIVLVEPEIPGNTGNISRTCAITGTELHLVKPLGFSVDDKHLKRAGLDYWHDLGIHYHENFQEILAQYKNHRFFYATTKAAKTYTSVKYGENDFLVFGKETTGLPEWLLLANKDTCIRIPMKTNVRSLNLSNSVAVILFEALRQQEFPGLT